jgi:hypothetical protein
MDTELGKFLKQNIVINPIKRFGDVRIYHIPLSPPVQPFRDKLRHTDQVRYSRTTSREAVLRRCQKASPDRRQGVENGNFKNFRKAGQQSHWAVILNLSQVSPFMNWHSLCSFPNVQMYQ